VTGSRSADDQDDFSDSSSSSSASQRDPQQILRERGRKVEDGIGRLVQLAIRLRRERAPKDDAKAVDFEPKDERGTSLVPEFQLYIDAICQRALNTRSENVVQEYATITGAKTYRSGVATVALHADQANDGVAQQFQAPMYLRERLKKTMLNRWRRISYISHHAKNLAGHDQKPAVKHDLPTVKLQHDSVTISAHREPARPQVVKSRSALNIPIIHHPGSAATMVRADLKIDAKKDLHPKTALTAVTKVQVDQLNFPRPPDVRAGSLEFKCPFCDILRSVKLTEKQQWE
jgi:hypothetical protein